MIQLLLRFFVKNHQDTRAPAVRAAYGKLAGAVGIACNALLALAKLLAGAMSGSIAIMADAVNNISDMAASVITLIGFRLSAKPADKEHPFGHARWEYLTGLVVAVLVAAVGLMLGQSSIQKIISPQKTVFGTVSLVILGLSILLKLWMAIFNRTLGRAIDSEALQATFADSRNDCLATGAVLVAAIISRLTGLELDGWIGLGVAVFILINGVGLIRDTLDPILGRAPDPELVRDVKEKISSYPGVLGTHDLIIHDYGPGRRFASAHVEMSSADDVLDSHDVIDNMERDFLEQDGLHLIIHYDPIVTGDAAVNTARGAVCAAVAKIDPALSIHDFRMVTGPTHDNYIFDLVLPPEGSLDKKTLQADIEACLQGGEKPVRTVITFDDSFAPIP